MRKNGAIKAEEDCADCGERDDCEGDILFLQSMPEKEQKILSGKIVRRTLKKGGILFREGERVNAIYMIRSGRIKLTRYDAEGREQIVGIFETGETIWEGMLLEDSKFPYSAKALTHSIVCVLYREDFLHVLEDPSVSMRILAMLSRKLHDANERNMVLSTKNPKSRLAAFLLYREKRDQDESIHMTLDDIAASLNMRPETVSRKLGELIDEGLIERAGKSRIRILDFEGMEELIS